MMTKEEYFQFHQQMCDHMTTITRQKNADYTGSGENPFKNFEAIGVFDKSWIVIGFVTRMMDKFARVASFIQKGTLQVKNESAVDSLIDLGNYCILFAGYLKSQEIQNK